jgi:hypothetical protein
MHLLGTSVIKATKEPEEDMNLGGVLCGVHMFLDNPVLP